MNFDMIIEAKEFNENKLKVLSSVPLKIFVKAEDGHTLEEITTDPDQMIYDIDVKLYDGMTVEVKLIPGVPVAFYPVVNAL